MRADFLTFGRLGMGPGSVVSNGLCSESAFLFDPDGVNWISLVQGGDVSRTHPGAWEVFT